jgi:hypothetical protein
VSSCEPPSQTSTTDSLPTNDPRGSVRVHVDTFGKSEINKNTESPKLEAILTKNGWDRPTVTAGVKNITEVDGYMFQLRVMDATPQEWHVVMKTDKNITRGTVLKKIKDTPR